LSKHHPQQAKQSKNEDNQEERHDENYRPCDEILGQGDVEGSLPHLSAV